MAVGARVIAGASYVTFHGTELQKAELKTTFFEQPSVKRLKKEVALSRGHMYNGYDPSVAFQYMPPIAVPPRVQETLVPSMEPVNVEAINASIVAEKYLAPQQLWSAVGLILMAIMKLGLGPLQTKMVGVLTRNGIPQGVAVLIALLAPWLVEQWYTSLPRMVTLYRKRAKAALKAELIGRIGLDDWEKLRDSMRTEERNLWRARSN